MDSRDLKGEGFRCFRSLFSFRQDPAPRLESLLRGGGNGVRNRAMKPLLPVFVACVACLCGTARAGKEKAIEESFTEALRVVEDKDGYTNIRSGPSTTDKVAGKAQTGSVVSVGEKKGDWTLVMDDSGAGKDLYIHGTRLKKLEGWKQYAADSGGTETKGTVTAGALVATVTAVPFVEKDHKIKKNKDGLVEKVDGSTVWGTDGTLPTKSLGLTVTLNGKAVTVPAEATHDLYEPSMESLVILTSGKPEEQAVVAMWNSDGAGGYMVAWSFVNGKYAGRTIFVA